MQICTVTGRPFDSYLNVLKPKQIVQKTSQQIFDHVVVTMLRQGMPCLRMDDVTGDVTLCNFNSSGFVSPLLSLFSRDDLRILKKVIGYEELQYLDSDDVYFGYSENPTSNTSSHWASISPTKQDNAKRMISALEGIGLDPIVGRELCILTDKHQIWYNHYFEEGDVLSERSVIHPEACKENFYTLMARYADNFNKNKEALRYWAP